MSLTIHDLKQAFKTYFEEMDRCAARECYWALLHLVVVMPDICAALEHEKGHTTGNSGPCYEKWCGDYWRSPVISPKRRWEIRCALLHQGRTVLKSGESFSYIRPAPSGSKVHEYVHPGEPNTTLEVDKLAAEVKKAIRDWFDDLLKPENTAKLANVTRYLRWLAKEKPKTFGPGAVIQGTMIRTTTSST